MAWQARHTPQAAASLEKSGSCALRHKRIISWEKTA
jgi:hypothetical protein